MWLQNMSKSVKEPPMTINLLCVLLLQAKQHLNRYCSLIRTTEIHFRVDGNLGGIFVYMCSNRTAVDGILCNTILVAADGGQVGKRALIDFLPAIGDDTDDYFFP